MKFQTTVILLVAVVIAAFTVLNWNIIVVPAELSLGVTTVRASLGLVMLGLAAALAILFLAFAVCLQAAARKESRRQAAQIQAARELAERAETSRYTKLREVLEEGLRKEETRTAESTNLLLTQLRQESGDLKTLIEQSGNTLAAYIGEVEDRLERAGSEDKSPDRQS
jgi:flagellar biosynthesis component FlhA